MNWQLQNRSRRFEFGIDDLIVFNLDLELHYVSTFRCTHQTGSNCIVIFIKTPDIAGFIIMINYFITVSHLISFFLSYVNERSK
ncbi:MAG: hypothetical protein Ct9H90mP9_4910 [Pseudomonadota bacterium]|nr:MAG: hypothetical protein Ct9H90mP9_4910 [Pseudomonadota bacterium]